MKVQLLICFLVFLTQEPLTIKDGDRRRGEFPISCSLPRHDAKDQKDRHKIDREEKKHKNQGRLQYQHMMHALMQ